MMKRSRSLSLLMLAVILLLTSEVLGVSTNPFVQRRFRIEEYELFYQILHPLQHEALPQKDFQRIRSQASELIRRGHAIVKLGVPEAPRANRRSFAQQRQTFGIALTRFKRAARTGNNSRLQAAYTNVHDSFEKLAELVPTVYPGGMPPIITIDCPPSKVEAGSKITLTAYTPDAEGLRFLWTVGAGRILTGQGTPTITIDSTGQAGQIISVSVEVYDEFGHAAIANCQVHVSGSNGFTQYQELRDRYFGSELCFSLSRNLNL